MLALLCDLCPMALAENAVKRVAVSGKSCMVCAACASAVRVNGVRSAIEAGTYITDEKISAAATVILDAHFN